MKKTILKISIAILVVIILIIPIIIFVNDQNKKKMYDELIVKIEDASSSFANNNLTKFDGNSMKVKLGELKSSGFLPISIKNAKTGKHLSNQSYVLVSKNGSEYKYDVKLYDIPDKETTAKLIVNMNGSKRIQNGISVPYEELGVSFMAGTEELEYSVQYFLKGEEVLSINSAKPKNYEAVYTAINSNGELAKIVRTIVVQ